VRRIISPVIVDLRDKNGRWYRHIHVKDLKSSPKDSTPADEAGASTTYTLDDHPASESIGMGDFEDDTRPEDENYK